MSDRGRRAGSYVRAAPDRALDELAARTGELAKRWAIALIEQAGPEEIPAVDLELIAEEGPALIDSVLAREERAAERSSPAGAAGGVATLAGADSAAELARAVESLREVLFEAAVESLPRARTDPRAARTLLDLGDRLAGSCAELLAAELERFERAAPAGGASEPAPRGAAPAAGAAGAGARIVIVDERGGAGRSASSRAEGAAPGALAREGDRSAPAEEPPRLAVRDVRPPRGPAAWIGSIGAQLEDFERDRRPFSVLLLELLEPTGEGSVDVEAGTGALERVLEERLRDWRGLSVTRERPGRYWLLAANTDRTGAEMLSERLDAALAGDSGPRRATSAVAIGMAVCPDDATDAPGLAAQADLDLYAGRSQGRGVAGR